MFGMYVFFFSVVKKFNSLIISEITKIDLKIFKEHGLASMDMFQTSSYSEVELYINMLQFQDIKFMCKRKGGKLNSNLSHSEWCQTVQSEPDVISMSFIPITSLLSGVNGSGYLTHAINLYLRCTYKT
ncbi:hypothetical protein Golax_001988 [Gossypium laxum]|uniref:MACPF domain-containing protein n=1 Tax=Gossypium laxum TaxID=34288 RepID=A0A7J9AQA3_9ROSI|nr:hypothetical protein [Gossypium laxum]